MNIKKKIVSGLVMGTMLLTSITPSLANEGLNAVSLNNNSFSSTVSQVAKINSKVAENVYILSSEEFIDGIPGGVLSGETNGAIVFIENGKLSESSLEIINSAKNVYAIGGENFIADSVVSGIENYKGRIAGEDRFDTAVKIASKLNGKRDIIITNGEAFADSLAATPLAVKDNMSILLVKANSIPTSTREYLEENKDSNIYFIGGNGSVSEAVKKEIYELTGKDSSKVQENTIAGANRYETSLKIMERFGNSNTIVIANGASDQDSLMASSLGTKLNSPVVLVNNSTISEGIKNINNVNTVYSVSTNSISNSYFRDFAKVLANGEVDIKDASGNIIKIKEIAKTGWATQSLNIRAGAGTNSAVIGNLAKGDKVTGVVSEGWLKFDYNGKVAYVSDSYISTTEVAKDKPKKDESNVSGNDKEFSYSKVMTVTATAYSRNEAGLSNKTASGIDLSKNPMVIAVDRRVIPLGTKVYVEGYGYAIAGDTGGAIKGNKIDVHFDSVSRCYEWGRKTVKLYILN